MNVQIEDSWKAHLQPEFDKDYFYTLTNFVREEYGKYAIYPPGKLIFNAFNLCPFDKVKVVIIGQDPYHGPGQAHGLCFSVNDGVPFPPSLVNIFKEIKADIGTDAPPTGNLTRWAEQGVLLLNATLTVRAPSSRLPSEPRLGNIYRCRHPYSCRRTGAFGLYIMGSLCTTKRCFYRSQQTLGTDIRTPFSSFRIQRFLRKQTFQQDE